MEARANPPSHQEASRTFCALPSIARVKVPFSLSGLIRSNKDKTRIALDEGIALHVRPIHSNYMLRKCRRFLADDPVKNVLPLGDLYPPLQRLSSAYAAVERGKVLGVCTVYYGFLTPSVVFCAQTLEAKKALVREGLKEITAEYGTICAPEEAELLTESFVCDSHLEHQMVAFHLKLRDRHPHVKVERVQRNELEELERFYDEQDAHAWVRVQFEAGPYYCVKEKGRIMSAAGVHIVTPQIAQLGNIVTDPSCRRRGYGIACTAEVAAHLARTGRVISLFVLADNAPAIRMYEKLGFVKKRPVLLLKLKKRSA